VECGLLVFVLLRKRYGPVNRFYGNIWLLLIDEVDAPTKTKLYDSGCGTRASALASHRRRDHRRPPR
jgi:hypothetical protein